MRLRARPPLLTYLITQLECFSVCIGSFQISNYVCLQDCYFQESRSLLSCFILVTLCHCTP